MLNSKNIMNNWESSQSSDNQYSSSQNSSLSNLQSYYSKNSTNSLMSIRPTVRFTYRSRKNSQASSNMGGTPKKFTNMINLAKRSASFNKYIPKKKYRKQNRSCKEDDTEQSDQYLPIINTNNTKSQTKKSQILTKSKSNYNQASIKLLANHQLKNRKLLPKKRVEKQFFQNNIFEIQQTAPQEQQEQQCHNSALEGYKGRCKSNDSV